MITKYSHQYQDNIISKIINNKYQLSKRTKKYQKESQTTQPKKNQKAIQISGKKKKETDVIGHQHEKSLMNAVPTTTKMYAQKTKVKRE